MKTDPGDKIPMLDLSAELESLGPPVLQALERVLRSGQFILGPEVEAFEQEVAEYLGVRHAIGVGSGTDALILGLEALGVGAGDEVVAPAFTFYATAEAIARVGASAVFVDIEPESFNLDPQRLDDLIGERCKAIIPVHLFGHPVDMGPVLEVARARGVRVLEDAAQAFGATYRGKRVGALADAAAFSLYPTKVLGAMGDAGLMASDDDDFADRVRLLRAHGARHRYDNECIGYNSRLDAMQAALLRVKLKVIDARIEALRLAAAAYDELLATLPDVVRPRTASYAEHVFHQYTIRITRGSADRVSVALAEAGIASARFYAKPTHRLAPFDAHPVTLPETERAAEQVLSLPLWPEMKRSIQERVVRELESALRSL